MDMSERQMDQATSSSVRQTHVLRELEEQPQIIEAIQQALSELDKRLVGVLRDEDMPSEKAAGEPHMVLVPLAEQLNSHNGRLRWIHQRLVSMNDRLEL